MMKQLSFEQGPIRPPSEARSLLLRFTRNCNWNQCLFCPVYKGRQFSRRSLEEVKADIDTVALMIREITDVSRRLGHSGRITREVAEHFFNLDLDQSYLSVVAWLYYGTGSVFLQDANNLIIGTEDLVGMLDYLHSQIEGITRVTSYARSQTAVRKSLDELVRIRAAGLNRIHIGMESGYDPLLKFMKKGVTAKAHIEAGQKIKAAGMELSEYYMPGLGGRAMWKEHAIESAKVLNAIKPDFIRIRTLRVPERIDLYQKVLTGEFETMTDDDIIEELRLFIENLDEMDARIVSDHMMNLLQNIEGTLAKDKVAMLAAIDSYLNLSEHQKQHYRLGRRMGQYNSIGDMERPELAAKVESMLQRLKEQHPENLENVLSELANRMI